MHMYIHVLTQLKKKYDKLHAAWIVNEVRERERERKAKGRQKMQIALLKGKKKR